MSVQIAITDDLATCLELRRIVFIQEQGVPEAEEVDAYDQTAHHLLATRDGAPVGTARVVIQEETAKIGRVCVLPALRGTGLGVALIRAALRVAEHTNGVRTARLGAQLQAIGFYEKLGFSPTGPVYLDAGIEHKDMIRALP